MDSCIINISIVLFEKKAGEIDDSLIKDSGRKDIRCPTNHALLCFAIAGKQEYNVKAYHHKKYMYFI